MAWWGFREENNNTKAMNWEIGKCGKDSYWGRGREISTEEKEGEDKSQQVCLKKFQKTYYLVNIYNIIHIYFLYIYLYFIYHTYYNIYIYNCI